MSQELNQKAASATKWSFVAEAAAKVISPVTQLILARLLAPEAFGMVATVTMVTSFAEMFSDSGFQKYLVQHEFEDREGLHRSANVAFWTNLAIALLLWGLIILFRDPLAALVGNEGLGFALAVASASLPMTSFVSIQMALYRREFEFKKLAPIRVIVAFVPLVVTVPLAAFTDLGFWALIIGTLASQVVNAVVLTAMSAWKPRLFYSFALLREMFSFSVWSLLEAISVWLTSWAGTFVVGNALNSYYLGLYKQPMSFVNSAFALITNATTPILFASLSRLQGDPAEFKAFFARFQFFVALFVLPLGAGIFFFRDFAVDLLLGDQWTEAALWMGLWGLSTGFAIVFAHYCSEVYRSLGRPRVSLLVQCLYMAVMIPAIWWAAQQGFECLVYVNSGMRLVLMAINQVFMYFVARISFLDVVRRLRTPLISTAVMALVAFAASELAGGSWALNALGIAVCAAVYAACCCAFRDGRELIVGFVRGFLAKRKGRR